MAARPRRRASGWVDLREGRREFASRQWLWAVVAQYAIVVATLNANVGVLGPLTAEQHLGPRTGLNTGPAYSPLPSRHPP